MPSRSTRAHRRCRWPQRPRHRSRPRSDRAGYTFIASISSIIYARAIPILAEIDRTLNLDRRTCAPRSRRGPRPSWQCTCWATRPAWPTSRPSRRAQTAPHRGLRPGIGAATGDGRWVRSPRRTFSFNIFKTITAGDGGMVVTDDEPSYRPFSACTTRATRPSALGGGGAPAVRRARLPDDRAHGGRSTAQLRKLDAIVGHLRATSGASKRPSPTCPV